jgi:hypothetical protein
MLFVYGTVYNSKNRIIPSLDSVMKINLDKRIFIIDNYSTDGTFEILSENADKYNLMASQEKCTRGWGRHLAIEMAEKYAGENDLFMFIDLDTVYNDAFARLIEFGYKNIDRNTVFLDNHLCYYDANHKVQWKDLTAAEDVEREARFISLGYKLTYPDHEIIYGENEKVSFDRKKRYARGIEYYRRKSRSAEDYLRGAGCDNMRNMMFFMRNAGVRKRFYLAYILVFLYDRMFKEIYNYYNNSEKTNIELIREKSVFIPVTNIK